MYSLQQKYLIKVPIFYYSTKFLVSDLLLVLGPNHESILCYNFGGLPILDK